MWAQVKVKRTLAWSTVAQMGFMMVQCGLGGVPGGVALHMVGHGCYKAWSFLRAGDLPPPSGPIAPGSPARTLALAAIGTVASIPALGLASWLTGFVPWHSPGEGALSAIVALSMGQVWVALFRATPLAAAGRVAVALLATVVGSVAIEALYRGAATFLGPVLGDLPAPAGPLAWASATLPVLGLATLCVVHATLPALGGTPAGRPSGSMPCTVSISGRSPTAWWIESGPTPWRWRWNMLEIIEDESTGPESRPCVPTSRGLAVESRPCGTCPTTWRSTPSWVSRPGRSRRPAGPSAMAWVRASCPVSIITGRDGARVRSGPPTWRPPRAGLVSVWAPWWRP